MGTRALVVDLLHLSLPLRRLMVNVKAKEENDGVWYQGFCPWCVSIVGAVSNYATVHVSQASLLSTLHVWIKMTDAVPRRNSQSSISCGIKCSLFSRKATNWDLSAFIYPCIETHLHIMRGGANIDDRSAHAFTKHCWTFSICLSTRCKIFKGLLLDQSLCKFWPKYS